MESLYRANRLSLVVSQAECICRWPALLRLDGTLVTRWAISRDAFQAYIDHVLAPCSQICRYHCYGRPPLGRSGSKGSRVSRAGTSCSAWCLQSKTVAREGVFPNSKAHLAARRTVDCLWAAVARHRSLHPARKLNCFSAPGPRSRTHRKRF